MPALEEWFPGAAKPDRRAATDSRTLRRPRHRIRAAVVLVIAAAMVAPIVAVMAVPAVSGVGIAARQSAQWWQDLPADLPLEAPLPQRSVILAADGKTVIARYYAENRVPVPLSRIPTSVVDALLATEDSRFYEHGAVDVRGTLRAVLNNFSGGSRQGGSGITQQYVKNLLLTEARTDAQREEVTATSLSRKIKEARLAVEAERALGKDGVLSNYLNTVYFGRGAYGIAAASERYFSVPVSKLTLPQAATLIGILKSPTRFDPVANPDDSLERRNVVLARMVDAGYLSAAEAKRARSTPLSVTVRQPSNGCGTSNWPFYCQLVLDTIANDPVFGATREARQDLLFRGGLRIVTSMDPAAMAAAQTAVSAALTPKNRVATAIAVVQPGTGAVKAIATSKRWGPNADKGQTEIVLPAVERFQPGSTFKPITLATALEQGLSPYATLDTPNGYVPATLNSPDGGFNNDDDSGHGVIDAFAATAESVNTFYVQLIERTGVLPVAAMARRLGMSLPAEGTKGSPGSKDAALTLGAFESSPIDVAAVYAALAAHGVACRPVVISKITRSDGSIVPSPPADCRQAVSPAVADMVTEVLQGVFSEKGTARGLGLPDRPAAGKTGTTNNSGATWFAGYTPDYAAAVWVGDPRGPSYPVRDVTAYGEKFGTVYGRTIAGPVWRQAMTALTTGTPVTPFTPANPSALLGSTPSVPDVRGMSRDVAISVLVKAGYRVTVAPTTAEPDPLVPAGAVAAQTPAPGAPRAAGSTVRLTLTNGSETAVRIPGQTSG